MNSLAKIITSALIAGSLLLGVSSCKKKSKEEDPKYIQRVVALEQVVGQYENTDSNDTDSKEVMINCLTDVKNMLDLFVQSYTASEKEYEQFVGLVEKYCAVSTVDVKNAKYPDLGALRRARSFIDTVSQYKSKFDQQHKQHSEQIELVRKIALQQQPGDMAQVCIDSSSKCYELFDAIEKTIKSDTNYISSTIQYAEKNQDKESELMCRLAKIFKKQRESLKNKAEYYKSTFKQHNGILQKYFPNLKASDCALSSF